MNATINRIAREWEQKARFVRQWKLLVAKHLWQNESSQICAHKRRGDKIVSQPIIYDRFCDKRGTRGRRATRAFEPTYKPHQNPLPTLAGASPRDREEHLPVVLIPLKI